MNKYLIKLANHLDKKGLHKEADYVDWIIKKAADPSLRPMYPKDSPKITSSIPSEVNIVMDRAISWHGGDNETKMLDYGSRLTDIIKEMWSNLKIDIATERITEENRQRKELGRLEYGYHKNFEGFDEDEAQLGKDISMDRMTHDPGESHFKTLYMDTPDESYGKIVIKIKRPKGIFKPKTTITVGYYGAELGAVKDFYFYQPGTKMDVEKKYKEISGITHDEFKDFYNFIKRLGNSKYFKSEFKYS